MPTAQRTCKNNGSLNRLPEEIERALAYRKIHTRIGWDKDSIPTFRV